MAVRNETKNVTETRKVTVAKTVGVTYASDSSSRKLKLSKSQRNAGKFVLTVDNKGEHSIVVSKKQLADFFVKAARFINS